MPKLKTIKRHDIKFSMNEYGMVYIEDPTFRVRAMGETAHEAIDNYLEIMESVTNNYATKDCHNMSQEVQDLQKNIDKYIGYVS